MQNVGFLRTRLKSFHFSTLAISLLNSIGDFLESGIDEYTTNLYDWTTEPDIDDSYYEDSYEERKYETEEIDFEASQNQMSDDVEDGQTPMSDDMEVGQTPMSEDIEVDQNLVTSDVEVSQVPKSNIK